MSSEFLGLSLGFFFNRAGLENLPGLPEIHLPSDFLYYLNRSILSIRKFSLAPVARPHLPPAIYFEKSILERP
jgi:hypothetical protein